MNGSVVLTFSGDNRGVEAVSSGSRNHFNTYQTKNELALFVGMICKYYSYWENLYRVLSVKIAIAVWLVQCGKIKICTSYLYQEARNMKQFS